MAEYDLGKVQGDDGVGIASVEQTTKSTESGGTNVITVTKTDGTSSTFEVMNGTAGKDVTVIDNLTKSTYTEGEALSAHQGYVLDQKIPSVEDSLTSTSTTAALSANQGYVLNNKTLQRIASGGASSSITFQIPKINQAVYELATFRTNGIKKRNVIVFYNESTSAFSSITVREILSEGTTTTTVTTDTSAGTLTLSIDAFTLYTFTRLK